MKIIKRKTDYKHCPNVRMLTVEGLDTAQSPKVLDLLKIMDDVPLIIEIGTCRGGFTLLLRKYFPNATIVTYDVADWEPKERKKKLFDKHRILFIEEDCFNSESLNKLVQDDRKKIIFCDGGLKHTEFNRFAPMINRGDMIAVHDYFESKDDYDPEIWATCEVEFNQLNMDGKFEQVYKKESYPAVWGIFKRK